MLSLKTLFQILFVWQENDLVFSSEFEKKKHYKKQHENTPFSTHTIQIKIQHDKVSISGPQVNGTQIFFYKIMKIVSEYDQEIPQ